MKNRKYIVQMLRRLADEFEKMDAIIFDNIEQTVDRGDDADGMPVCAIAVLASDDPVRNQAWLSAIEDVE